MIRCLIFILLITTVIGKGGGSGSRSSARGGRSSGYGGGGTPKSRTVRGSVTNTDSGYRRNSYAVYAWLYFGSYRRNSYLYNEDPKKFQTEEGFDCGNGKHIRESQVCNWIDDCGNGIDERVPLPCEGNYSERELNLYIGMTVFYLVWVVIICYFDRTIEMREGETGEDFDLRRTKIRLMTVAPIILLFINSVFLLSALGNGKSIIIEYYITNCVFIAFGICIAICSQSCIYSLIWLLIFSMTISSLYHGSMYFSHIPTNILTKETITNITTNDYYQFTYLNTTDIYNISNIINQKDFWLVNKNESAEFVIDMEKIINLAMITIYPTHPNKTTNQFKISTCLNLTNCSTRVKGPMPLVNTRSALEIILSDEGIPMRYLRFTGYPDSSCNLTNSECLVGLDELAIYSVSN